MSKEHKPPTTQAEALRMIEPLDPAMPKGAFTKQETELAYMRLVNFLAALLPK
jgi:hypothetical protein